MWDPSEKTDSRRWWESAEMQNQFIDGLRGTLKLAPIDHGGVRR